MEINMPLFTEKSTVENYIIDKLKEKGWKYIPGEELGRDDYSEPLLLSDFVKAIKKVNKNLELSESDVNRVLAELKSKPASFGGSKHILRALKQGIAIKLEKTRELRYIDLLDRENPENNEFVISNQVSYESSLGKRRLDIVLYVNGVPLVVLECKSPVAPGVNWRDAYDQIRDYEKTVPELFKYVQFSIAAAMTARYFPNVLGLEDVKTYLWREEGFEDDLDATLEMLSKPILVDLLLNYIFAREERGTSTKVLPRFMQYKAANRIFERVVGNLEGKEEKDSGLIWHWQGSGKTLAMIFATYKLYRHPELGNPTILLVVDRNELEEQLNTEFSSLDLGIAKPEVISSIKHLKEVLTHDDCRGKRGIFITLVHKFAEDISKLNLKPELKLGRESENVISNRKNVVVIIDEGHRTQYGKLAEQMREILKSAFFFAFTGTPIAKKGRDTYLTFSYPDQKEPYLHKYFIEDSIRDGFTLPIVFQTRMEKKVGLKKSQLENFLKQELEEIPEDIQERVKGRIGRRLSDTVLFLKNPRRIGMVARDIAAHFKENIDGKFKGMVVAACREACVTYKERLDGLLPPEYTEVVMTFNPHADPEPIANYYQKLREKYQGKQIDEIRKEIIRKFKEDEYPKILIVTDMLLTGFDAPILEVMYLDKPLKEHRLLQAIARTNRPFKRVKEAGLIIDYVGTMGKFEKALALYRKQDIQYAAVDLKEKVREFRDSLEELEDLFEGIDRKRTDRKTLMSAVKALFLDKKAEKEFLLEYSRLRRLYEFLGPRRLRSKDIERFKWLTAVHQFRKRWSDRPDQDELRRIEEYYKKYFNRTVETIHKTLDIKMKEEFPVLKLDDEYLNKLQKAHPNIEDRVYDMVFALNKYVLVDRSKKPLYEPIARRVERAVRRWREKKIDVKEAYERLSEIFQDTRDLEKRKKELKLPEPGYFLLVTLEKKLGRSKELVEEIRSLWENLEKSGKLFEGWNKKPSLLKEVGREIRKFLRKKLPLKERNEAYEEIRKGLKEL
jgi:type I restriction enzyme R subunit